MKQVIEWVLRKVSLVGKTVKKSLTCFLSSMTGIVQITIDCFENYVWDKKYTKYFHCSLSTDNDQSFLEKYKRGKKYWLCEADVLTIFFCL